MAVNPFAIEDDSLAKQAVTSDAKTFGVPETGVYLATVQKAYIRKNAYDDTKQEMVLELEIDTGSTVTFYLTVLENKKPYTVKDGKKVLLRDYVKANKVCIAATGKTLAELFPDIKPTVIQVYDFDAGAEVPKKLPVIGPLVGTELYAGITRRISNKYKQIDGKMVAQAERKTSAILSIVANLDKATPYELENDASNPGTELEKWEKANAGKDWDQYKPLKGASKPAPQEPSTSTNSELVEDDDEGFDFT